MRYITLVLISLLFIPLQAQFPPPKGIETIPVSKTSFELVTKKGIRSVNLLGKRFIVVSVREAGSDGRYYAVEKDGTVWASGAVTSGAEKYRSPSGIFPIIQKKRHHMSTAYPDPDGINNMDYMMKFTRFGHALHKGSVEWMSHGCIHIDPKEVVSLYEWADFRTKIVITRHTYMPYARDDLLKQHRKVEKPREKKGVFDIFDSLFSSD